MRKYAILSRGLMLAVLASSAALLVACGGGGGGGGGVSSSPSSTSSTSSSTSSTSSTPSQAPVANQLAMTVEQDPNVGSVTMNVPYVTVTVCDQQGVCTNVDHVLVDTMSTGFRVFASALNGLSLATPGATPANLAECTTFMSGYMWGSVRLATLKMAGEVATNIPIQVAQDPALGAAPASCSGSGVPAYTGPSTFAANGVLGVAVWAHDGQQYFDCSPGTCQSTTAGTSEVSNAVASFPADNNGVVLSLPAATSAQASLAGTLTFGVDTQPNNSQSGYTVLQTAYNGMMTSLFNSGTYSQSFVDSGSNTYALTMPSMSTMFSSGTAWLNPPQPVAYPVTLQSIVGATVYNASVPLMPAAQYVYSGNAVMPSAAVAMTGNANMQDYGLPFFYGKSVALTFGGHTSSEGTGPAFAFH
jgi:hypothetical protein